MPNTFNIIPSTYTIRDYSTTKGGGFAVTHAVGCADLQRKPSIPDVWVSDDTRSDFSIDRVERLYRARFTVPFEIVRCPKCVGRTESSATLAAAA
jgi:hypothetical protein